ncbi:zinc knuckle CX2CX4HX4C containing protein [Tanacetum coccineum]
MADNTRTTPKGIVENLLVRIDKFNFPVDFVILDMVEDLRIPIILGRPLLARAHAKVDIFRKSISLEVGNEKVIFKIKKTTIHVESVCAIGSEVCILDDDLRNIDHDLFLYDSESCIKNNKFNYLLVIDPDIFEYEIYVQESYEDIKFKWSMIDQGEPWDEPEK